MDIVDHSIARSHTYLSVTGVTKLNFGSPTKTGSPDDFSSQKWSPCQFQSPTKSKQAVGELDSIVVGSWPSLHDAHGYKPSVLHQYLSNHVTQATLKIAHNYVYYYVSYNILMFSHYLRHPPGGHGSSPSIPLPSVLPV